MFAPQPAPIGLEGVLQQSVTYIDLDGRQSTTRNIQVLDEYAGRRSKKSSALLFDSGALCRRRLNVQLGRSGGNMRAR